MKVTFVVREDSAEYYGGGEVQVDRTRGSLEQLGVEVEIFAGGSLGDLVHFFGLFESHAGALDLCRSTKTPWVCSPIFVNRRKPTALVRHAWRNRHIRRTFSEPQAAIVAGAQAVITPGSLEYEKVLAYFRVAGPRFSLVNGVEDRFRNPSSLSFREHFNLPPKFALCVAHFDKDKNQLTLAKAARLAGVPTVFVGAAHNGGYEDQCRQAAGAFGVFLGRLEHKSPLLPAAYREAEVFCLPSRHETFSLATLEALVSGCPAAVGTGWRAEEFFGSSVIQLPPQSVSDWARILSAPPERPTFPGDEFRWDSVAKRLHAEYERILEVAPS